MTLFHVGEKVVYPNQGIGIVENISTRAFGSRFERFYLLRLAYAGITVMVPFSHVQEIGLRRITRNGSLVRVLVFLSEGKCQSSSDWKFRFKENTEKMRAGTLQEIAEVLKTLLVLQKDKPLSFREKHMLQRARYLMIAELSTSRSLTEGQATEMLQKALSRASLNLPSPA